MIEQGRIEAAKAVNLVDLLRSRGLVVKKQGRQFMALCPFHEDHHPSLAIDPGANLFKCFGCGVSGDSIRFVELYEKKSFPEAVRALAGAEPIRAGHEPGVATRPGTKPVLANQELAVAAEPGAQPARACAKPDEAPAAGGMNPVQLLNRVAAFYHEAFLTSPKPQEYLAGRGITRPEIYRAFQAGYADGRLLETLPPEGPLLEALKKIGVLNQQGQELFLHCVIFPLLDAGGNVAGLYGRKLSPSGHGAHLHLPGKRRGLVNRQAAAASEEIILTESILDALSLYQNGYPNVIPLYGTNGLTNDHLELFREYRPQKIHLCLNSDEPGKKAAARIAQVLGEMGLTVGVITLPEHKDLNDFFQAGKTRDDFTRLLVAKEQPERDYQLEEVETGFLLTRENRQYRIRGILAHSFERLRVNIRATCGGAYHIDSLDLYQSKSRKSFAGYLAKLFQTDLAVIESDLFQIITEAEARQAKLLAEENKPQAPAVPAMSQEEEEEARRFLQSPDLMEKIMEDLEAIGHVGEESRKLLAYLIAVSRKLERPLSGIIISGSGAGKSGLVEKIQELVPPEEVAFFSRITPQALYYMERDALKRKLLILEERTGGEGADYSIRTLQSRKKLTQAVPIKDPNSGKIKTMTFEVEGPIAYLETTTRAELNHENATRCFEIYLDESMEQTRRIHEAQRQARTLSGMARKLEVEAIKKRHHNAQRLLKTIPIFNPYAPHLDFPADTLRTRRDHERFLSLIEAVTFLHQYQRPIRELDDGQGGKMICVESTVQDYAYAYGLARELLGFTLDDLRKHARDLLDRIKELVCHKSAENGIAEEEVAFTRREIRQFTGWPDYQLKTYIRQLEDLEYLVIEQVKTRGQFEYRLNHPEERRPLKGLLTPAELERFLAGTMLGVVPGATTAAPGGNGPNGPTGSNSPTGTTGTNGLSTGQSQE